MGSVARVVIIGAGVVGASAAYHLAELGWTDVAVVDMGPMPATGGSSSHAPGLVFQTNPSQMMTALARDTVELYTSLDLSIAYAWLPVELAAEDTPVEIVYFGGRRPARVVSEPRFDPGMVRMRS